LVKTLVVFTLKITNMTLQQQLKEVQREHPQAWIGYNANTGKTDIYIIPISWCNSLFIQKI